MANTTAKEVRQYLRKEIKEETSVITAKHIDNTFKWSPIARAQAERTVKYYKYLLRKV
jgi:hypothetical protein